jgi:hypothetical protein
VGQWARWVDSTHIEGVAAPTATGTATTGDAKLTLKTVADTGWVMMNDGTIGDAASGGSTRANVDCLDLFTLLWNNIPDAWCPVTPSGRGASAVADWTAHKAIKLPRQLGRSLAVGGAGAGLTSRALGSFLGEEAHAHSVAEMPAHTHAITSSTGFLYSIWGGAAVAAAGGDYTVPQVGAGSYSSSVTSTAANNGSGTPFNVMQPTSFWNIMIKL